MLTLLIKVEFYITFFFLWHFPWYFLIFFVFNNKTTFNKSRTKKREWERERKKSETHARKNASRSIFLEIQNFNNFMHWISLSNRIKCVFFASHQKHIHSNWMLFVKSAKIFHFTISLYLRAHTHTHAQICSKSIFSFKKIVPVFQAGGKRAKKQVIHSHH